MTHAFHISKHFLIYLRERALQGAKFYVHRNKDPDQEITFLWKTLEFFYISCFWISRTLDSRYETIGITRVPLFCRKLTSQSIDKYKLNMADRSLVAAYFSNRQDIYAHILSQTSYLPNKFYLTLERLLQFQNSIMLPYDVFFHAQFYSCKSKNNDYITFHTCLPRACMAECTS